MNDCIRAVESAREFFEKGATRDISYRKASLLRLRESIVRNMRMIEEALAKDLGKSPSEAFMTEIGMTLGSIRYMSRNIRKLSKARKAPVSSAQLPGRCRIMPEPYGTVLIMSPWNYPLLLTLDPLVAAVAAGNSVVIKPSAYSPATGAVLERIVSETFEKGHVNLITGGRQANAQLLEQKFDYIFFTGGKSVGKFVMQKASVHLTPVTLELGGKSPVIILEDADIKIAARRIAFGKCLNSGQTCVAPDYVFVDNRIKDIFICEYFQCVRQMYGDNPSKCPSYGKIINRKHYNRLTAMIEESANKATSVGENDFQGMKIAPTVIDGPAFDSAAMNEEIFGPVLPVLGFDDVSEAVRYINSAPKPLAAYFFTSSKTKADALLADVPFGGGCINDTILHIASTKIPFGGVGESGMGSYHGKWGFRTFSHYKSILIKGTTIDPALRYQPFSRLKDKIVRTIMG